MSYREVRSFCEMMRSLGYRRVISMENFRSPNFQLVAELLYWLLKRFDPETTIQDDIEEVWQRVQFLQDLAQAMLLKARVKLNIKRLYAADGSAVRELLKIASLLYKAARSAGTNAEELAAETGEALMELSMLETQSTRQLIGAITQAGETVYEELGRERELKEARQFAIAKQADRSDVERTIQEAIDQLVEEEERLETNLEDMRVQQRENGEKLKRKRAEFERMEKRLAQLKHVKPPYQKELDDLESQLQGMYTEYLNKFRTLEYLQSELDKIHQQEQQEMMHAEAKLEKMRRKIADNEMRMLRGQSAVREMDLQAEFRDVESDASSGFEFAQHSGATMMQERPPAADGRGRVQGSLMAAAAADVQSDGELLDGEDSGEVEVFASRQAIKTNDMDGPANDFFEGISDGDDGSFDDGIDDEF